MANVYKWASVTVQMQSALGSAVDISSISKANPGVVTQGSPSTSVSAGDYIVMTVNGMHQLDGRVFRVASPSGATFTLEGEDTSLYDTFTSGSFKVITYGVTLQTARGLTAAGGDFDFLDTTTIHDNVRKQIPGLASAASYTLENLWDAGDSALQAMKTASDNQAQRAVKFIFGTGGPIVVFNGYVGATLLPTGNAQELVTTPAVFTMHGRPKTYTS